MKKIKVKMRRCGYSISRTLYSFVNDGKGKAKHRQQLKKTKRHSVLVENNSTSVAIIYRSELDFISRCILDYPDIETGGQLFGFWTASGIPVVLYALGPGPRANHEVAFFNQDVDYLVNVGNKLIKRYGLQHIGEWHSHHHLGLSHPSGHDAATMRQSISDNHLGRFLLCIGTCDSHSTNLNAFCFSEGEYEYHQAAWQVKEMSSPFRNVVDTELSGVIIQPINRTSHMDGLLTLTEDDIHKKTLSKPNYVQGYWLSDKANNKVLKNIIDYLASVNSQSRVTVRLDSNKIAHVVIDHGIYEDEVSFPERFPNTPPKIRLGSGSQKEIPVWEYNGDIFSSFVEYYNSYIYNI